MDNDTLSTIDLPGKLRRLLKVKGLVIVSEFHRCSSYAHFLATNNGATVAFGLSVEVPTGNSATLPVRTSMLSGYSTRAGQSSKGELAQEARGIFTLCSDSFR